MGFRLSIIAAVAENDVIGAGGELPWHLPDELRYVRRLTMGHCLLMGRHTWEAIRRPLPGRTSIVVASRALEVPEGVLVVDSLDAAVALARERGDDEPFAFGGERIYAAALERADRLYLTRVHAEAAGDARFPAVDWSRWRLISEERHEADERHAHAFTCQVWERRR